MKKFYGQTQQNLSSIILLNTLPKWSDKEVKNFIDRVTEILEKRKSYPEICRPSAKRKNVRIAILNKHTKMVYNYMPRKKRIEILLLRNFKQNPAKFNY